MKKGEIIRQVIHILVGLGIAGLYWLDIISPFAVFLGVVIGGLVSLISKRVKLPVFSWFLARYERNGEKFPGRGMVFFFVGVLLVMKLFTKDIALAAIMILALGDSVSHLWGGCFGKLRNIFNLKGRKWFEGTIIGMVAGFAGAALFVGLIEAFLASFAAMAFEVIDIDLNGRHLDDNLIVPLVAGTVIFLLRRYL